MFFMNFTFKTLWIPDHMYIHFVRIDKEEEEVGGVGKG